jgi:two-component system, NtrC family, sensor histidine kinase HydH
MASENIPLEKLTEPAPPDAQTQSWAAKAAARMKHLLGLGADQAFRATRWFAVLGLFVISAVSIGTASVLSHIMADRMLRHDGEVALEFVQGVLKTQDIQPFFLGAHEGHPALPRTDTTRHDSRLEQFFAQIAAMPNVLHANVYDVEHRVIWSSNPDAKNRVMSDNEELDEALKGELVIESSPENLASPTKLEHFFLNRRTERFVENYIPVFDPQRRSILGVVEIYKSPAPIFATIDTLIRWIWLCALLSGALLFATLYWIMRRAERVIGHQQRQLVANEAMVAVGEMASAVAHGIRNPLASIRTSAELMADVESGEIRDQSRDIVSEVDRLEQWVRSLLTYAGQGRAKLESIDLNGLAIAAVEGYQREFSRLKIATRFELANNLPRIIGNPGLLTQMLNSIIANAIEAMPQGGTLSMRSRIAENKRAIELQFIDTGIGISPEQLQKIFQPLSTNKRKGLGMGLALVKRTMERIGGSIRIDSQVGRGTQATLVFPAENS